MPIFLMTFAILFLNGLCVAVMIYKWRQQPSSAVSFVDYLKLTMSGIVAFIADTIGIGSFAVNVALVKLLGTFPDEQIPAVINGAQILPGLIEALFFMKVVNVDLTTLLTLVSGTCIGGLIGGIIVSRLSKQAIRLGMMSCFAIIIMLLISHQLHWLTVGGDASELHGWKLIVGFFGTILCGALTSVGIGLFVLVQSLLFLLNVSPLVAFPIMTAAGAMQQPLTTLVFVQQNKIPLKKTFILSLAGCVGVVLTLLWFTQLSTAWLHSLLIMILIYNLFAISRTYLEARGRLRQASATLSLSAD